ncbi:unnamed protein product [Linum trigynum]|uniref:Uncharacterized protein n=1 Tax=Linum trigynum TaxID=586398 RepID=A0AAV2E7W5_9ROSI
MNIPVLINRLGWTDILQNQHFGFLPEAVRMQQLNIDMFNYLITVNVELLSLLLGIPVNGSEVMDAVDFQSVGFDDTTAFSRYTQDTWRYYPNMLSTGRLPDDLKAQFVLRKVDASVGRRRPRVNAPGGGDAGAVVLHFDDALSIADLVDEPARPSNTKELPCEDGESDDSNSEAGISDYMSSPSYPF